MKHRRKFPYLLFILVVVALACLGAGGLMLRTRPQPLPTFTDVTEQANIRFRHNNGAFGKKYMPETTGSGCAFFDYNNDGWLDILAINSRDFPGHEDERSVVALYRNNHNGTFSDVAKDVGLDLEVYGMGCAAGDYDNDGWLDVYVTCLGPNYLFHNEEGKFKDVTKEAGVRGNPIDPGGIQWKWSGSAAWVDYDRDGLLDLFVLNYVRWTPEIDVWCGHGNVRGYCPPNTYLPTPDILYHNNGDGTFTDVSQETGIAQHEGKGWGVAVCDFDEDGFPDLAIANDTWQNYLFHNVPNPKSQIPNPKSHAPTHQPTNSPLTTSSRLSGRHHSPPTRRFEEVGTEAGIAFSEMGHAKAGMGIDVADFENKGTFGITVGNFSSEGVSLFQQEGKSLVFNDVAHPAGVGATSLPFLTFGLFFFDYDLDGWKDVFCANGHIDDVVGTYEAKITYAERPLLFRNQGAGKFEEMGLKSGAPLKKSYVLRGCAFGDYDNDGDLDVFVVSNNRKVNDGRARLWRNDGGNHNNWIRFALRGHKSNRFGFGAKVQVVSGDLTLTDILRSGSSYLSQSEPVLTFGLGRRRAADRVMVTWPSGEKQDLSGLTPNRLYEIEEGRGVTPRP